MRLLALFVLAACGRVGFDGTASDAIIDGPGQLAHVTVKAGWRVEEFHDFSAKHAFHAMEFADPPDNYSNLPTSLFVLEAPFPRLLGMTAGRAFIEIGRTEYIAHDYGSHPPNQPDFPDGLLNGTFVPDLDNNGP